MKKISRFNRAIVCSLLAWLNLGKYLVKLLNCKMRNRKNLSLIVATQINRDGQIRTHTLGKKREKNHTDLKDLHAILQEN